MKNREIYQTDPETRKLVNEGVASVNDDTTTAAMNVLRYELETFVCDGQYSKGMEDIIETFLKNINQSYQPAVWISGFYGSGKSHLAKMLRALWIDTKFEDGATARGIAELPSNIKDLLQELNVQGRKHGGRHAASGTLGSGASGSVRLALLRIIFKSIGLPEQYPVARFVMWLQSEGIYHEVKSIVERNGEDWEEELDNFYVAESLHEALVEAKPNTFSTTDICAQVLNNLYPHVPDISSDEMIKAIKQALTKDDMFPLTLIVLDEIQQFIGEDSQRSIDVQEVVEACSKNIGGKLLFIGTGQTAVTGTSNLKKLEGRFTIRVELNDTDVDAVIRKVILGKKSDAISPIENIMNSNIGEISRHLDSTTIGHNQEDAKFFIQDYPILPVRRRFWENTLRILDQTGTDSQLRNQLSMIHKVIKTNLNEDVGSVAPADFLYFESAEKLLQARILPRKIHERTMSWIEGTEKEKLMARATSLVFLINKLSGSNNEIGITANVNTIADLMVTDLQAGSSALRSQLPEILEECPLIIKVGDDEYRIQTEESSAWNEEFLSQTNTLANQPGRVDGERVERIKKHFNSSVRKLSLTHGDSKEARDIYPVINSTLPPDSDKKVYIFVKDGWNVEEASFLADARQAGNNSSTIFVFIPKKSSDDLRHMIIEYKASVATLGLKSSSTPEGIEARSAMETTKNSSEARIKELLDECFYSARVFQGGGQEILGNDLQEKILEASKNALKRLYPDFKIADSTGWDKVYSKAKLGDGNSLKSVSYDGDVNKHPVCKQIFNFIAGGKKGQEIRSQFESSPYGWSRDAIDGGLYALIASGIIKTEDERGKPINYKDISRKDINKTQFKIESTTITTVQLIQIRKVFQKAGISINQGEESSSVQIFIDKMKDLANNAGGDAPKPKNPNTTILENIRLSSGNEQLLQIYNQREELGKLIEQWQDLESRISKRFPLWQKLKRLASHSTGLTDFEIIKSEISVIETERKLIEETDLITPLVNKLTQGLREELNKLELHYNNVWETEESELNSDENWNQIDPDKKHSLRLHNQTLEANKPIVNVETVDDVISTLESLSLHAFADKVAALPSRYNNLVKQAAKVMEPEVQEVKLPSTTIKSPEELENWITIVREKVLNKLENGPVIL